jgi:hypothetical protein
LLSLKIGGPSVFPAIQPEGVWDLPYNDDKWTMSKGEDKYRRGLYTFMRRTSPYPSMLTFDGTSRESCTVRRMRTDTPLQALTTLNDPAFFEAAQALSQTRDGGSGSDAAAHRSTRSVLCTGRKPKPGGGGPFAERTGTRARLLRGAHQAGSRQNCSPATRIWPRGPCSRTHC